MKTLLTLTATLSAAILFTACTTTSVAAPQKPRTIVVWSEGTAPTNIYPKDINAAIVEGLKADKRFANDTIIAASINDPDQGITDGRAKALGGVVHADSHATRRRDRHDRRGSLGDDTRCKGQPSARGHQRAEERRSTS